MRRLCPLPPLAPLSLLLGAACVDDEGWDTASPIEISEVILEEVDGNVLACRLLWTTDRPTDSAVIFEGPDGQRWQRAVEGLRQEHEVLVVGMRPETKYELELVSSTEARRTAVSGLTFTTGEPPAPVRALELTALDEERVAPGWTLFDLHGSDTPPTAVIVDPEGTPVWYHQYDSGDARGVDTSWTAQGTITMGGSLPQFTRAREVALDGEAIFEGRLQKDNKSDGYTHHHFERLPGGGYVTVSLLVVDGTRGDVIEVWDEAGDTIWSWSVFDHMEPEWHDKEWTHANWAAVDDDYAWLSDRNSSLIHRIDRATGEVLGSIGEGGDYTLISEGDWYRGQHAPQLLPDDHMLVLDNQGGPSGNTRVMELALDHEARTAELVWEYFDKDDPWRMVAWGNADRLSNGNTLIGAGSTGRNRLMEVTEEGEVVWELILGEADGIKRAYRAQRMPTLAEPL